MFLDALLQAKWYPVLFDSTENIMRSVAFWLTLCLIAVFVVCAFLVKNKTKFFRLSLSVGLIYACALIAVFLVAALREDGIVPQIFAPLLILCLVVIVAAVAYPLVCAKRPALKKPVGLTAVVLVAASFVALLVSLAVYYGKNYADDGYYNSEKATVNQLMLYLSALLVTALIVATAIFGDASSVKGFDTKSVSYAGVCVAMSFALSYVRVVKMPQGGSITLASLLPLAVYAYMFGTKKGVLVGFAYGLLQAVQDSYPIHPAQFLLDYPVAFASIGLAGLFSEVKALDKLPQIKFALGAIAASVLRFVCHLLSGVFAFAAYAGDMNPWAYSAAYNSFVFIDIAIVVVAGAFVFSSKTFVAYLSRAAAGKTPVLPDGDQTNASTADAPAAQDGEAQNGGNDPKPQ